MSDDATPQVGSDAAALLFSGKTHIPVRNLWLLMLYASDLYVDEADIRQAGLEDSSDGLMDIVAEVLVAAAERRLHRPLSRRYGPHHADLTRVRGRIDHLRTHERGLLARGRVACRFDELSVDHLLNQVVASGLMIAERASTELSLRERAATARRAFLWSGVSARMVAAVDAAALVLGRNDEEERRCVSAARLLLQMALFTENTGAERVTTPLRDIERWRRLYEAAVRGFFRTVLQEPWEVRPFQMQHTWPLQSADPGMGGLMPRMETDVQLRRPGRTIVIETKFTSPIAVHQQFGSRAFKRDHLFQLQTYLTTLKTPPDEQLAGVLLYPQVDESVDMSATVGGHTLRVKTIDLAGSNSKIRAELLSVADI